MIAFNAEGYITPSRVFDIELDTFKDIFVNNEKRELIYTEFLLFVDYLKSWNIGTFNQWVDGSFVTKKIIPNDIDVVTFLDYRVCEQYEKEISELYWSRKTGKVDTCFVKVYPSNHDFYVRTKSDTIEYLHNFSFDVKNRNQSKGFVQLNF